MSGSSRPFREIASLFTGVPTSLANSSGVNLGAPFQFDLVRPGAALYGRQPDAGIRQSDAAGARN